MNIKNAERLKNAIIANANALNMYTWACTNKFSPCGTVGCIAGFCDWLMAVDGSEDTLFKADGSMRDHKSNEHFESTATSNAIKFLGIGLKGATKLFFVDEWPENFAYAYEEHYLYDDIKAAKVVCDRIDYFIENGE